MKKFFIILTLALTITQSHGAKLHYPHLSQYWGNGEMNYCGDNDIANACIGEATKHKCAPGKIYSARYHFYNGKYTYTDEFSNLMMMAREFNEHGALFCPTQLDGQNDDDNKGYTAYYEPNGTNTCVWLCQAGWTGPNCNTPTTEFDGTCNLSKFLRSNYSDIKSVHDFDKNSKGNIEDQIPFFYINDYQKCSYIKSNGSTSSIKNNEHDMGLFITRWLDSGNGAFARQMIVLSKRTGTNSSDIYVYPASKSTEILVCINGYQPNLAGTDCEPINHESCTMTVASQNMCGGWTLSGFDSEQHVLIDSDGCYKYTCKKTGNAFAGIADHTCTECTTTNRGGIEPNNGTCVKCPSGTIFNKKDTANNFCSPAIGLSKSDMMYGRGKTKNNAGNISEQCWTMTDPDKYKECVLNQNNGSK